MKIRNKPIITETSKEILLNVVSINQ